MAADRNTFINSFNSGEIVFEDLSREIRVHSDVEDQYSDIISEKILDVRMNKALEEDLYDIFVVSPFYEKYRTLRKLDKNELLKIYYHFKHEIVKLNKYSTAEVFMAFAEFFQVNYDVFYGELGVLDKEELLKEVSEKYGLQKKIKTKKLF